jgi:hypothetical protein
MCNPIPYNEVEFQFDDGDIEPTVGETLTRATSLDTGKVTSVTLEGTGTWAGNDAAGTVVMNTLTGLSDIMTDGGTGEWGQDNELINGSVGGASMLTLNGPGIQKRYGTFYPLSDLVLDESGHYLCHPHWEMRWRKKKLDESEINIDDT